MTAVQLLVVNPNTSPTMTEAIHASATAAASPGTMVRTVCPEYGPDAIDSAMESYLSAVAVIDRVTSLDGQFDAVVTAGFGEHGRDALAEVLTVPVLDIAECAAIVAQLLGRTYAVVTTLQRSVAAIEDRLLLAGLDRRCATVRACGWSTAAVDADPAGAVEAIVAEAAHAVRLDHAEVVCLGCGGMGGLADRITAELGVPVVDGVAAAVRMAEALVGLGLSTSKVCTYAFPEPNQLRHWPLSQALGLVAAS